MLNFPKTSDVESQDFHTKASDGHDLLLRWFTKKGAKPTGSAICYAHGGGMIALQLKDYDTILKAYASYSGVPFLAVEYRLAPEVQAPTLVTDVYAGLQYLHEHASELGVDPKRIGVMGDSAGGGISASLAHYAKSKGGPAIAKQILVYPMLDDRNTTLDEAIAPFAVWSTDDNKTGWGALLGDRAGKDGVTPIEAAGRMTVRDAEGLPPAYIDVGELVSCSETPYDAVRRRLTRSKDIFREEDLQYAQTLGKAGVSCEFHLFPNVPHAWEGMAPAARSSQLAMGGRIAAIQSI